jgi:hypothetical protein
MMHGEQLCGDAHRNFGGSLAADVEADRATNARERLLG